MTQSVQQAHVFANDSPPRSSAEFLRIASREPHPAQTTANQPRDGAPARIPMTEERIPVLRRLWRAVLELALRDATYWGVNEASSSLLTVREQQRARHWLLWSLGDFAEVCEMAGYDSAYVRERMFKLRDQGWRLWALAA